MQDMPHEESNLDPVPPSRAERVLAGAAAIALFVMGGIVTINVVTRWIAAAIIPDDVYLIQEFMVLLILLPLGVVTAAREHIQVDVFTQWVARRGKLGLAVLEHLVGLVFVSILLWAAWNGLVKAWETQEYYYGTLNVPMWIGHTSFFVGIGLFWVRLVAMLYRDLRELF